MCLTLAAASVAASPAAATLQGQEPAVGLTAEFVESPESHDGSAAFTVRVEFTDEIARGTKNNLRRALTLSGAGLNRILRVDNRLDLFEITLTPEGDGDATVALGPSGSDCTASDAICTSEGTALTGTITASIPGPPSQSENAEAEDEFTAEFVESPESHDGSAAFTVRVEFTDEIARGTKNNLRRALTLSGAGLNRILRVDNRLDLFEITLTPEGDGDATVALGPSGSDCTASDAICTSEGTALTGTITASIPGPPSKSDIDDGGGTVTDETEVRYRLEPRDHQGNPPWTGHTVVDLSTANGGLNQGTLGPAGFDPYEIEHSGDSFWFRLRSVTAHDVFRIEAYDRYFDEPRVTLYRSDGTLLTQGSPSRTLTVTAAPKRNNILGSAVLFFIPDADSDYYLEVDSAAGDTGRVEVKYQITRDSRGDSNASDDCPDTGVGHLCRAMPSGRKRTVDGNFHSRGEFDVWEFFFRAGTDYRVCVYSTGTNGWFAMLSHNGELAAGTTSFGVHGGFHASSNEVICDQFNAGSTPKRVETRIYSSRDSKRPGAEGGYRVEICQPGINC